MISHWLFLLGLLAAPEIVMSMPKSLEGEENALDKLASVRDTNIPPAADESTSATDADESTSVDDSPTSSHAHKTILSSNNATLPLVEVTTQALAYEAVSIDKSAHGHDTSYSIVHTQKSKAEEVDHDQKSNKADNFVYNYGSDADFVHNHKENKGEYIVHKHKANKGENIVHNNEENKGENIIHNHEANEGENIIHNHEANEGENIIHNHESNEGENIIHNHEANEGENIIHNNEPNNNDVIQADVQNHESEGPDDYIRLLGPLNSVKLHPAGPFACFSFLVFTSYIFSRLMKYF